MKRTELRETVEAAFAEAAIDRQAGMIEGASLLGRVSRNDRFYSDAALRDAARLYEGCPLYLDHPKKKSQKVRSVRELAGRVRNPRVTGDRVRGDLQLLSTENGRLVAAIAEQMPDAAGISHRARGAVATNSEGRQLVKRIDEVRSVDLVTEPATVDGLLESIESAPERRPDLADLRARLLGGRASLTREELAEMEQVRRGERGDLDRILEQEL